MSRPRAVARTAVAAVIALLPLLALAIAATMLRPSLGAEIASHWGNSGPADGFSATWSSFWTFGAITAGLAILAVVTVVFAARQSVPRTIPMVLGMVAGLTACAWIIPAWATADAATPGAARLGARLLVMAAAVAAGAAIYLLLPPNKPPLSPDAEAPTLPLADDERVFWTGLTGSRVLEIATAFVGLLFVGMVVLAVVLREGSAWTGVVIMGIATLLALALTPARLTIDRRGIRLSSALLRIPLIRVALDNIESVTADTIDPMKWGGWGYRISGAGLAYVARRGPGIVITRSGGNGVAITVDDPAQPAAVANALIAQLARQRADAG